MLSMISHDSVEALLLPYFRFDCLLIHFKLLQLKSLFHILCLFFIGLLRAVKRCSHSSLRIGWLSILKIINCLLELHDSITIDFNASFRSIICNKLKSLQKVQLVFQALLLLDTFSRPLIVLARFFENWIKCNGCFAQTRMHCCTWT